ncbi:hypothetical protein ABMA27_010689 [Loxostege sticticalis]|uniref:EGF-like domain-containing protein n=1 Tax=Loxostege sticticalis TaxID=481309 RepID=A0ABR3H4N0_LOXSC
MVNRATGKCEDIDECEESSEVCKRNEVCINLAGAYNCKSKISTLPKLATKTCQEGTRLRAGGTVCEDIDECREGTHLCDQFQNCVNTYGGHECRCKNGFELDSSTGSCVDIDECALKLDNCAAGQRCLNVLGAYTCTRAPAPTLPPTTTLPPYEYDYYDSDEESSSTDFNNPEPTPTTSSTTTPKPTTPPPPPPPRPTLPPRPPPNYPNYPSNRPLSTTTRRTPYTNRSDRPRYLRPTTSTTTELTTTEELTTVPTTEETPSTPEVPPSAPELPPRPDLPPRPNLPPRPDQPPRPEYPRYPDDRRTEDNRPDNQPARPTYRPNRPYPSRPSEYPPRPRPTEPPRRPDFTEVPAPEDPVVIEKDKDKDGSYDINTSDIPKNRWTTVTGREKPTEPDFDVNNLHCLNGFERDAYGNCVDINECEGNRHICSTLEQCVNMQGGYRCDCVSGFVREPSGWCIPARAPTTTARSTTTARTTTSTTTTERTTTEVASTPRTWRYTPPGRPYRPPAPYTPPTACELGYTFDSSAGRCVDIDECAKNEHKCAPKEECVNQDGGYYCMCGPRCRGTTERPPYEVPSLPPPEPYQPRGDSDTNIITVGAQYGQRGPRYLRPTFTRLPNSGAIVTSCSWGYKLTPDKMCYDIDECAKNVSQCGPSQRCENFFGGYSCQCPAGHKLYGKDSCEDIDECAYGSPCPYNAKCVNTVGSYRCECGAGFRNSPSNDKVCVDIDECTETPQVCHQSCSNAWGSYRCYCKRGYRLDSDNRTCVDVDECAEWGAVRLRGRLCGGECVNEPGSYRCACPAGYRLSDDGKSCIDIDECETGEASCAASRDPGFVCQNTRGSYHCHHIECPQGYKLEAKHRCTRIQRSCPISDWSCLKQPSAYSYNFITFVANIYMPSGSVDLFTMHGPSWRDSVVSFELRMIDVQAGAGVRPADLRCFDMRPMDNVCVISLLCSLGGPQVAELELTMSLYQRGQFAGNAVARLIIIVSQYEF